MRRVRTLLACGLLLATLPLLTQADNGDLVEPEYGGLKALRTIPNQYIVVLRDTVDVESVSSLLTQRVAGQVLHRYNHALKGFAAILAQERVSELLTDPSVIGVYPDAEVSIVRQWGHLLPQGGLAAASQSLPTGVDRINAEGKVNKGAGVEVAVIDTGIDLSHPDLKGNILGGKRCIGSSYNDQNGHGSHVAGTIAALDNGTGVVGVAPQAKLWAVRVLDASGYGTWSSVICGVDWVTSQASHIKVANMSLGGSGTAGSSCSSSPLRQAICNSVNAGVTYIVAAGNSSADLKNFVPAAYPEVTAVTALADSNGAACGGGSATSYGADDTFASFSNYATLAGDAARTIGAPGVSIHSTWKNKSYKTISGTSMASPHAAGAAALYLSAHPGATPAQVRDALLAAAEPDNVNFNGECASGVSHTGTSQHPEAVLRADSL